MFVKNRLATLISANTVASDKASLGNTSSSPFLQEPAIVPRTSTTAKNFIFLVSIYFCLLNDWLYILESNVYTEIIYSLCRIVPATGVGIFGIHIVQFCPGL